MNSDPAIFAITSTLPLGEQVAAHVGVPLSKHEEQDFADGEHNIRPLDSVRGRDVYVIQSLYSDHLLTVNDKLMRLLVLLGATRDAGPWRLTAVVPYLAYSRKDERNRPRDPVTTRYIAQILEAVGTDAVMTLDVHNPSAYENAFRIPSEHLQATGIFADYFAAEIKRDEKVTVVSPDAGGLKRAGRFQEALASKLGRNVGLGFMVKSRENGELSAGRLHGDVNDAAVIVFDDMISTGGTLSLAAERARDLGAKRVIAAASHGLFAGDAERVVDSETIDQVVITDSVPPVQLSSDLVERKVTVLSCAPLLSTAIMRLSGTGRQ